MVARIAGFVNCDSFNLKRNVRQVVTPTIEHFVVDTSIPQQAILRQFIFTALQSVTSLSITLLVLLADN
jgi:hypothetical protein